jgi:uncharacterized protein YraI
MKKVFIAVVSLLILAFNLSGAENTVKGKVVKYPLNVRAGAGMKYTALLQLDKDYEVEITGVGKQWITIKPPENTRVWVLKDSIRNGKLTSNVNFRSGPSTGYEAVGIGRRGMKVTVHGKATNSGWIQISAPRNIELYVGKPAVAAAPKALAKLPKIKEPVNKPLPNEELINLEGNFPTSGKDITVNGYVYAEKKSHLKSVSHVFYELVGKEDLVPRYMVMPNRSNLDKFKDKKVRIYGEFYKVKGWKLPLLIVKTARAAE